MLNSVVDNSIYMTVKEISEICEINERKLRRRCVANKYTCRLVAGKRGGNSGKQYEILVTSLEPELQEKIYLYIPLSADRPSLITPKVSDAYNVRFSLSSNSIGGDKSKEADTETEKAPVSLSLPMCNSCRDDGTPTLSPNIIPFSLTPSAPAVATVPEKAKRLALAKVDIINHWEAFRNGKKNKKQADKEFLEIYNGKILSKNLYSIVGKISLATLYRWNKDLKDNDGDYTALIPNYNYGSESIINTKLTKFEQSMFIDLMLRPSKMAIGKAYEIVKYLLNKKGYENIASYTTYKRYASKIKRNYKDIWVLMREGEKALKDKVAPYIMRDASVLNVGDVLIADGNTLDFQVINPFTGKPCRATMIVYLDWKSEDVAGYEIMLTENTQCIASALRNAIIRLGKIPTICYQDNGAAFRSKFFRGDTDFEESGFYGLFGTLGIIPVFATPYNARAKIVERFFREFTQSCACLMPSYIGNCIDNKPAYMKRNEKFHKSIHNDLIPTIEQAVQGINAWLDYYRSRECPNVSGKTIGEVFNEGRGDGVDITALDDLMMAQEERKICRNGVRMFNTYYWNSALYGIDDKVVVKYSLLDITKVKVYSRCGDFICTAECVEKVHAMAGYLGDAKDVYSLKQAVKQNKNMVKQTMQRALGLLPHQKVQTDWQEVKQVSNPVKKAVKKKKFNVLPATINLPRTEERKYKIFN